MMDLEAFMRLWAALIILMFGPSIILTIRQARGVDWKAVLVDLKAFLGRKNRK